MTTEIYPCTTVFSTSNRFIRRNTRPQREAVATQIAQQGFSREKLEIHELTLQSIHEKDTQHSSKRCETKVESATTPAVTFFAIKELSYPVWYFSVSLVHFPTGTLRANLYVAYVVGQRSGCSPITHPRKSTGEQTACFVGTRGAWPRLLVTICEQLSSALY